jgi:hypothetical protein
MFRSCVHFKVGWLAYLVCYTRRQPCRQGRGGGFVGLVLPDFALMSCRKGEDSKGETGTTRQLETRPICFCRVFGRWNRHVQIGNRPWRYPVRLGLGDGAT